MIRRRLAGASLVVVVVVVVVVVGCTVSTSPAPSASSSVQPASASAGVQSPLATAFQAPEPTPTPTASVSLPAPVGGLPRSWTRSADLLAIDSGSYVTAAPGGGFMAVVAGVHRVLVTLQSPDGQTWAQISEAAGTTCGQSAVCGITPTGLATHDGTIAMIGRDESTGVAAVWTSREGRTWTRIRTLPDLHRGELSALVSTPSGFAAAVQTHGSGPSDIGVALGSADGSTWSVSWLPAQAFAISQPMLSAVAATQSGYVALGSAGMAATAWSSRDGRTWIAEALPGAKDAGFGGAIVTHDREVWAFVPTGIWDGQTANAHRWVSTDGGATWVDAGDGPHFNLLNDVLALRTGLVALGRPATYAASAGGPIWTSADGVAWTAAAIGGESSRTNDAASSIAESNGRVVVAGWTDIDKGTATGDDARATGRLVFWAGDAPNSPTLALPRPEPSATPALASSSPGTSGPTTQQLPHQAPEAEALLPTTIGGTAYATGSQLLPIETDVTGGDMCWLFCPGEVGDWARKAGVKSGLVSEAFAIPTQASGSTAAVIVSLSLPIPVGAAPISDTKLLDTWVSSHAGRGSVGGKAVPLTLGGKRVLLDPVPFFDLIPNRYIYAHQGTLFAITLESSGVQMVDPMKPGPVVEAMFAALP